MKTHNSIVDAVGQMNFGGNVNVIPQNWYRHLIFETKGGTIKPDLLAIIILSEIVYWYRPTVVRDEETGRTIGYRKKFRADLLQRSIDSFADQFGITKRQSKDALFRLESDYKIIHRHYRNIHVNGRPKNNVLFIELFPDKLKEITFEEPKTIQKTANSTSEIPCDENPSYGEIRSYDENPSYPMTKIGQTNTSITYTKTTSLEEEEAKAPAPKFHLFEEYRKITGKTPNGIQSPHLMRWVTTFPPEVLQEALNRLEERAPDNPFSYLKSIMEDWQAKKLLTLEAVLQHDKKQESPKKRKSVADDTGESGAMINGHYVDF